MPPKAKAKTSSNAFIKKTSAVNAIDGSGTVLKAFYIWTNESPSVKADPDSLFAKCSVLPGSNNEVFRVKQVEPPPTAEAEFEVKQANAFNCNSNLDPMAFPDIGLIPHTNIPCVLDFIKQRYTQAQIYTTADPLLVAVNPFKNIGNATDDWIVKYRDASDISRLDPHCFSIARTALENLHMVNKSQTVIVSGESGAGKTEATKMMMRFFASAKSGTLDTRIQSAVMAANPVLEAFGNAKTIRNNNSSRFGRFMQLQVAAGGGIEYGSVRNFLLEKSRLLCQEDTERSYHVFYFLLKGANAAQQAKWKLKGLEGYRMINPACVDVDGIDDVEEWGIMDESFDSMLLTPEMKDSICSIISGCILLGNCEMLAVEKQGIPDAAELAPQTRETFVDACNLLFLDPVKVEEGVTVKITVAGGQSVRGCWRKDDGAMLRDSLSKAMYDKLFDWIIKKLNTNIEPPGGFKAFLGMLDIFGFEVFKNNSLEQLFINITNEMLQKNFCDVVFEKEQKLYATEGISSTDLTYTSNKEVIDILTAKKGSLMAILEDQCLAPGGSDEKFLASAFQHLKDCTKIIKPKVAANINFLVSHTIGDIQYTVTGFLFKNNDVLRGELVEVVQASENVVTKALCAGVVVEKGKGAKGQLIGSQFMNQLDALMALINSTEPHFVRCVKPNETKRPLEWNAAKVLIQLHSLSILEALQLRNLGYSYRRPFEEFLYQFKFVDLGIAQDPSMSPMEKSKKMLERAKISEGTAIGKTMVFMKPGAMKAMAAAQRECMAAWEPTVALVTAAYQKRKYRLEYESRKNPLERLQALARRKLAGKVASPSFSTNVAGWA